jgi:hypothetical protein
VREAFEQIRLHLRELGIVTKVPIEPPPQTTLLDKTMSLPGVVCAGVPGAGGYDAIFALCIAESLSRLQTLWTELYVSLHSPSNPKTTNKSIQRSSQLLNTFYFSHIICYLLFRSVCTLLARADNRGLEMVPYLAHLLKQNNDNYQEPEN